MIYECIRCNCVNLLAANYIPFSPSHQHPTHTVYHTLTVTRSQIYISSCRIITRSLVFRDSFKTQSVHKNRRGDISTYIEKGYRERVAWHPEGRIIPRNLTADPKESTACSHPLASRNPFRDLSFGPRQASDRQPVTSLLHTRHPTGNLWLPRKEVKRDFN